MDSELTTDLLVGVAIAVGLVGVVVPILPGTLLVWGAVAVWAVLTATAPAWTVLAVATVVILVAQAVKYLVPHRRLRDAGVPTSSIVAGGVLAVVGFFVIPVVGLVVGFVVGIYLAELRRLQDRAVAWRATRTAVGAVGVAILVELAGALVAAVAWLSVAVVT